MPVNTVIRIAIQWETLSLLGAEIGEDKPIFFIEDRLRTLEEVAKQYVTDTLGGERRERCMSLSTLTRHLHASFNAQVAKGKAAPGLRLVGLQQRGRRPPRGSAGLYCVQPGQL